VTSLNWSRISTNTCTGTASWRLYIDHDYQQTFVLGQLRDVFTVITNISKNLYLDRFVTSIESSRISANTHNGTASWYLCSDHRYQQTLVLGQLRDVFTLMTIISKHLYWDRFVTSIRSSRISANTCTGTASWCLYSNHISEITCAGTALWHLYSDRGYQQKLVLGQLRVVFTVITDISKRLYWDSFVTSLQATHRWRL
jgi:hypothetical protein